MIHDRHLARHFARRLGQPAPRPAAAAGRPAFRLTGARAEALAERLLDGRSDRLDLVWDEIDARLGHPPRVRHDWDPATRTLSVGGH